MLHNQYFNLHNRNIMSKKKKKEAAITDLITPPTAEISASDILTAFIRHLKEEHNYSSEQISKLIRKEGITIPVSIFTEKISCLETVTKYLIEVLGLKNKDAAKLLNRNARTIWTTYQNAVKKFPQKFSLKEKCRFSVPASEFQNRLFSALEVVVMHLKENYNLGFHEIAALLKRDDSTVWTVYHRALKKSKK